MSDTYVYRVQATRTVADGRHLQGLPRFLQPLEDKGLIDEYEDILEWLKEDVYGIEFDGRQIRNIVTTALGLARAEDKQKGKEKLSRRDLKSVVKNARSCKADFLVQFDRYINAQEKMIN